MTVINAAHRFRPERGSAEEFIDAHGCDIWVSYRKSAECGWLSEVRKEVAEDALRYLRAAEHLHAVQCAKTIQIDDKSCAVVIVGYDPEWMACTYGDQPTQNVVEVCVDGPGGYMFHVELIPTDWNGTPLGGAA